MKKQIPFDIEKAKSGKYRIVNRVFQTIRIVCWDGEARYGSTLQPIVDSRGQTYSVNGLLYDYNDQSVEDLMLEAETSLRSWTIYEASKHIGHWLRWKPEVIETFTGQRGFDIALIVGVHGLRVLTCQYGCNFALETLLKNHDWSEDNGKTWLPCGVEE